MTWTYGSDPGGSPADEVRFLVGDVNAAEPWLSDGEVAYVLARAGGDSTLAALLAAESLWLRFAMMVDQSVGSVSISFSQRAGNLEKVIAHLRARAAVLEGVPYGGGISRSDVAAIEQDRDRVPPRFYRDVLSDPGSADGEAGYRGDPALGDI